MNQIITPFKWGFFLLALFGLSSQVFAQQFSKSIGSGSSNLLLGDPSAVHTQLLYDASDIGNPGTNKIDRVYFRRAGSASTTLTNLTIRLTQTPSTSGFGAFASSSFFTGLTTVYFASSETIPAGTAGSWFSFDISTFSYDPSQRLVVDVSYSSSSNNAFSTTNSPIGNIFSGRKKLYTNNSTSPTGTHTSDWEDFGIDFAPLNDECSNPDWLDPGANCSRIVNSTTFASSQSFPASNCDGNSYSGANDVWFSFFSSGLGDTIRVAALDPLFNPVVDVFNSCPPDTRIDCADKTGKGGTEEIRMANLQPGTQYWVRVFGADAFKGAFSICLRNKNNPCVTPPALIKTNVTETTSNGSVLLELLTTPPQYLDWQQSTDQGNTWSYLNQYDPIDTVIA
ncbi:MAG TPA: hypothetical protein PKY12_14890, partial [Catalimonadaceae bacterium]|nr:hypothetical protein [Catalimonadaceae bacterium]